MISWLFDIASFAGSVAVVVGVSMVHIPAGIIVAGVMLLGFGLWGAKRWAS